MTFIFWQNIISPHQNDFLVDLASTDGYTVKLVVDKKLDPDRVSMGWEVPIMDGIEILVSPGLDIIKELLTTNVTNTYHIYSGVTAYPVVWQSFKLALKLKCKIGLMSEPGDWKGWKGKIRLLKSKFEALLFKSKVDFILSIGHMGRYWFEKSGYPKEKIFDWGYFVSSQSPNQEFRNQNYSTNLIKLIYVGRLSPEKGLYEFINVLDTMIDKFYIQFLGEGPEKSKLQHFISKSHMPCNYIFHDFVPNSQISSELLNFDYLILPSTGKDGWGTVVNEALQNGLKIITSSNCGASTIITNENIGYVFNPDKEGELKRALEDVLIKGKLSDSDRRVVLEKAASISPVTAKLYFLEVIDYVFNKSKYERPNAPWI